MKELMTRKRYSREFKAQAVELVEAGRSPAEVAEELEIALSNLYKWVRISQAAQRGSLDKDGPRERADDVEADELRRLRREVAQLRIDNDILKKAAVIMGTRESNNDAE